MAGAELPESRVVGTPELAAAVKAAPDGKAFEVRPPEEELKEFLEEAVTGSDEGELDDALELIQQLKARRLAKKGICPCCKKRTDGVEGIPACTCAEKRATCVRCATDDAKRTDELCVWCVIVERVPHCVLCMRPPAPSGSMCPVCAKAVAGDAGGAMVDPASNVGSTTPHSPAEFSAGLGKMMEA